MFRISRYGRFEVGLFAFVFLAACFTSKYVAVLLLFPLLFFVYFYRDPDREADAEEGWLSPADGKVVEILDVEHEYLGKAVKIGIFMNGYDVHVNRFPTTGTV